MQKTELYRTQLQSLQHWDEYLLAKSGLPGPRGNLELAHAVADLGNHELFFRYLAYDALQAPVNSPYEFLAFCGAEGLGRLLAEGQEDVLPYLRACASDPRWRMREAVAMALQRLGRVNMPRLLTEMQIWSKGSLLEQRAAIAGLCEPALLTLPDEIRAVFAILDHVSDSLIHFPERKHEEFIVLRKGLAYCWSVAVCALPSEGKAAIEKWFTCDHPDMRWVIKENLKKSRLLKMDSEWVNEVLKKIGA